jgi:hypothetical protein
MRNTFPGKKKKNEKKTNDQLKNETPMWEQAYLCQYIPVQYSLQGFLFTHAHLPFFFPGKGEPIPTERKH